jgi:hypothetical protein
LAIQWPTRSLAAKAFEANLLWWVLAKRYVGPAGIFLIYSVEIWLINMKSSHHQGSSFPPMPQCHTQPNKAIPPARTIQPVHRVETINKVKKVSSQLC